MGHPKLRHVRDHLTAYTVFHTVCVVQDMNTATPSSEVAESLTLELRRGSLVLAVLAALRQEHYGYTLRKTLAEQGLEMEESTLYPLLRRLETQGLLTSEWREEEKRRKRFYRLSAAGEQVLAHLLAEYAGLTAALDRILAGEVVTPEVAHHD